MAINDLVLIKSLAYIMSIQLSYCGKGILGKVVFTDPPVPFQAVGRSDVIVSLDCSVGEC